MGLLHDKTLTSEKVIKFEQFNFIIKYEELLGVIMKLQYSI